MLLFSKNKAIDILLNAMCIDFGEDKLAEDINVKRADEIAKLFENYEFTISHSPDDIKLIISEFNKLLRELNEILAISNYRIHSKALEELLDYSIKYKKDKAIQKSIDTIFQVVNETRGKLRYEKIENFYEIRIQNERWRLYCDSKNKIIIGFDYEHKTNNHRDIIPKLRNRL